jgi:hypothetical protein
VLAVDRRPDVALVHLARRQDDLLGRGVLVGDQAQQVADAVEPGAHLVVASTTHHGDSAVSVAANMASLALE